METREEIWTIQSTYGPYLKSGAVLYHAEVSTIHNNNINQPDL